tara:strand:- start:6989 stop:7090 length:102 start_codon:yes stop_codon:yes gene_type:complete
MHACKARQPGAPFVVRGGTTPQSGVSFIILNGT